MTEEMNVYEDVFREMVRKHDVSYNYSDDHSVWKRGQAQYDKIVAYAKQNLTKEDASRIWNEEVSKMFRDPTPFLWLY